jgi:uncharacterized MAPEG superfamily protein
MTETMTAELYWLAWSAAWTSLLWIPYAAVRIYKIGFMRLVLDPLPGDDPFDTEWAHRAYRAHMNALETLVPFAAVTLAVVLAGANNDLTADAAKVYFFAKLAHAPVYILKTPVLRLVTFMLGLGATLLMAAQLVL